VALRSVVLAAGGVAGVVLGAAGVGVTGWVVFDAPGGTPIGVDVDRVPAAAQAAPTSSTPAVVNVTTSATRFLPGTVGDTEDLAVHGDAVAVARGADAIVAVGVLIGARCFVHDLPSQ
jgi:hypothetical protein